jgi:hypothetical protein
MGFKPTIIGLVILSFCYLWSRSEISRAPGVLAPDEPYQREVYSARFREINGYRIELLATFDIRARVIATERYWFDQGSALSPVDLVLGWGATSDSTVLKQISVSQSGRFYHWWVKTLPLPRRLIETQSANMHMIPASGEIARQLKSIRAGNMVHLKGYLVEATSKEGFRWKSSLTRTDTGSGACELILVESIYVW